MTDPLIETCVWPGEFEIRARGGSRTMSGKFPYDKTATRNKGGRVRKERFRKGSMGWQVREFEKLQGEIADMVKSTIDETRKKLLMEQLEDALERRNTFLLVGHSYDKAIADMRSGTLAIKHTDEAVEIEATLPALDKMPSWVRDAVLAVEGGQLRGISPGFVVGAKGGERLVPEDGPGDALVREITDAVVFEYSLVARPSYASTTVDTRAEENPEPETRRRLWL